jgi:hypothetical protein
LSNPLYAVKDKSGAEWESVRHQVGAKLLEFFEAFSDKISELSASNMCTCGACTNVHKLKLKVIAHSGHALFYSIGRFEELSGVDVIVVHRLAKNSLKADQYILMTQAAYRDVAFPQEIEVTEGQETYASIGTVDTYVYYPPGDEMFFLEIQEKHHYDSAWYRLKNRVLKNTAALRARLGLIRKPEFKNLPTT